MENDNNKAHETSQLSNDQQDVEKKPWHAINLKKMDLSKTEGGSIGGASDASVFHS